jgi:F-type H+-transporting ATPase subunit b
MWLYLLAQEHGSGAEIDPTNPALRENLLAAAWSWAIFIVLMLLLWKLAWGPIAKGLEGRAHRIAESLKKAEEIEKSARELTETNKQLLAKAQADAQQLVADARNAATTTANELLAKANAEIEAQRERHKREMELVVDKARADMRRDAVELTIAATARLIGKSLTDADSRRLASEALADAESVARN